jgi:hypothetical protein
MRAGTPHTSMCKILRKIGRRKNEGGQGKRPMHKLLGEKPLSEQLHVAYFLPTLLGNAPFAPARLFELSTSSIGKNDKKRRNDIANDKSMGSNK